jgi:hypothetical protein
LSSSVAATGCDEALEVSPGVPASVTDTDGAAAVEDGACVNGVSTAPVEGAEVAGALLCVGPVVPGEG